ncbi:hypothetical protein [Sulfurovum sp.]|uniref:hypothetical protein n=1 Tax=Sulfurovum sp. TaxID=1969726 RepID=UPI0025F77FB9|nr:hypothetical protein [Sulfurovum sp.]
MDRCQEIKAHIRMEERYEGLSLIFGDNMTLKNEILQAINDTKKETGKAPFIFDKVSNDRPDIQCIYMEFHDDVHREAGDFFTRILQKLNIDHCEKDI